MWKRFSAVQVSIRNFSVKSYNDIPGPKGIFGIGNFYNYTSLGIFG